MPVACFSADVHKRDLGADVHNYFAALDVEEGVDDTHDDVSALPNVAHASCARGCVCGILRKDSEQSTQP